MTEYDIERNVLIHNLPADTLDHCIKTLSFVEATFGCGFDETRNFDQAECFGAYLTIAGVRNALKVLEAQLEETRHKHTIAMRALD